MTIKIRLFGVFRQYGDGHEVQLTLPVGADVLQLKRELGKMMDPGLLKTSYVAGETRVLGERDRIQDASILSLIPGGLSA